MSSLSSKFSTRVEPEERAARRRQRLESDLEPGRVTVPSSEVMGVTVSWLDDSSRAKDLAMSGDDGDDDRTVRGRVDGGCRKLWLLGMAVVSSHAGMLSNVVLIVSV